MLPADDESRMSPMVRRLRRDLRARGYGALAEQVPIEQVLFAHAAAHGIAVGELMRQWTGEAWASRPQRKPPPPGSDDDLPEDEEFEGRTYEFEIEDE